MGSRSANRYTYNGSPRWRLYITNEKKEGKRDSPHRVASPCPGWIVFLRALVLIDRKCAIELFHIILLPPRFRIRKLCLCFWNVELASTQKSPGTRVSVIHHRTLAQDLTVMLYRYEML